jgi:LL-diaminopimelate aminotransferase
MQFSERMNRFGESVFTSLKSVRAAREAEGKWVCDLSIGTPNIPPAQHLLDTMARECADPKNYVYAISDLPELQDAVSEWYARRYGVELNPRTEISSLLGSQEGLSHIAMTLADNGSTVLVPDPCYPVFGDGPALAGAELCYMPLKREKNFIIDFADIPTEKAKAARLMVVSYPNNPTTAVAPDSFYRELVAFAKEFDIAVLHDNAYSELIFDGVKGGSFLRFEGAKDVGVEFNSLSKTYGLAGARIGFCVGNPDMVRMVKNLKSNMDYGMFIPVQKTAIAAITGDQSCVETTRRAYERRRDVLCDGLREIGWQMDRSQATMFVWAPIPPEFERSADFAMSLVEKTGVLVTPGSAFGPSGEGFVRMALVQDEADMRRAISEIEKSGFFKK